MIQFFWLVHGLKHLNLWEWTSIWLTNSLVLTFVCSFSTEETWHQFNRILVQYLAVTTHHFHCLSLHQVNSDSSLSMSWVYSSAIFSLSCWFAVLHVQTHPPMSISCLMRAMWAKQFPDHSFTSLGLVIQPIYTCSSPLVTGKALCQGMSQVQAFHLLALLPVSFFHPLS